MLEFKQAGSPGRGRDGLRRWRCREVDVRRRDSRHSDLGDRKDEVRAMQRDLTRGNKPGSGTGRRVVALRCDGSCNERNEK
jgi:hypothetical protein